MHSFNCLDDSARILLEETLNHKKQRYADQKRITTKVGEGNSEIAERIAAAAIDSGESSTGGIIDEGYRSKMTNGRVGATKG